MDDKTLVIRNFVYDGEGPDAFFTVGVRTRKPNPKDATPIRLLLINVHTVVHYKVVQVNVSPSPRYVSISFKEKLFKDLDFIRQ